MQIQRNSSERTARFFRAAVFAIFSIALCALQAKAQHPKLVGTWTAKADIMLELGAKVVKVPREISIKIDKINGTFFTGSRTWKALTDDPGYVTNANVLGATEPFIGTIESDGVTLRLVETDDFA
ncbi:MAG: hypothetical protein MJE12_18900 [Alphaproteobacteria bacterium]|nr:hypothetical protein [Alphaproteobacteria bacterium]